MKSIQSFSRLSVVFTMYKLLVIHSLNMKYSWSCSPGNEPNDWWLFTHQLQLITSMAVQVLHGVGHLLLTVETKHAGHQCRHTLLLPVASGCTIHSYAFAPGANQLPRNKWIGWDLVLLKGHRTIKPILHQVNFSQYLSPSEVTHWDGDP